MEYEYCRNNTASQEARSVVEAIIEKSLPSQAIVHHINGNVNNNEHSNLVACEDQTYHKLLHRRTDALIACGHANWRRCTLCKEYDDPKNLYIAPNDKYCYHRECKNQCQRERQAQKIYAAVGEFIKGLEGNR
jgi:hypothetical protein